MSFVAVALALASQQVITMHCPVAPSAWRRIAGTEWRVQACDDGASVGLTAAPGNPLAPATVQVTLVNGKIDVLYIDSKDLWLSEREDERPEARALLSTLRAMRVEELKALHDSVRRPTEK